MEKPTGKHARLAEQFNADEARVDWHDETLFLMRNKRDKAANKINDWEALRTQASTIKNNVLSNLHNYLLEFEERALENGIQIHWATDASAHNQIVLDILRQHSITELIKSKSMLTEECQLNEFLEQHEVGVIDTDLGERIVQLAKEPPSHIVLPCIHKKKEEIGILFAEHMGTAPGESDPQVLTAAARLQLRQAFMTRRAALTGVNFAVAETGEFVVCTNEGNADMGAHLAEVHIAAMGIEKIIPRREHLGVFLRLLTRSATGQPITTYSSHFKKPRAGQQMHIILVDNGRSAQLGREDFRNSLKCIRCGACMNTCPVYRRSGGHSYHNAIAGPIGAILAPNLDMEKYADLPFASTLCGSCTHVCPVKIDIHDQLYKWRQVIVKKGFADPGKVVAMKSMAYTLSNPGAYKLAGKTGKWLLKHLPLVAKNNFNTWYKNREMPAVPKTSFNDWYIKQQNDE